jgi:hypothetical protein
MEGNGLLTLDLRLSKVSEQAIDRVLVEAKNPPMEPVRGELTVTEKTATGSLEVFPGKWLVVVEAFSDTTLCYRGEVGPVDVVAGKSTETSTITLEATRDLVADRIFLADTDWNELAHAEERQEVLLVLVFKNIGSEEATGWREEAYIDGALTGDKDGISLGAGKTKRVAQQWTAEAGTHTIEFRLDTENVIGETDETNNTASLTFTVRSAGIIAGQSVDGVDLGFTKTQVRGILGPPDEIDEDGDFMYDSGIIIIFDPDRVMMMMVFPPYSGTTERGIELGATASQIEGKYGADYTVEDIGAFAYFYWSLGIAFIFDESNICYSIAIFPSAEPPEARGIIAGQSVDGVDLGFTKTQVSGILGPPDEIDEDGDFMYDSGIMIIFDGDRVTMMMVFPPYSGTTERGIELGATASQIEGKYGADYTGEDIGAFAYFYWSLGIAFVFNESNICYSIAIFSPPAAKAALMHTDTMERIQRCVTRAASEIKPIHPEGAKAALSSHTDTRKRLQKCVSRVALGIKPIHTDYVEQLHKISRGF